MSGLTISLSDDLIDALVHRVKADLAAQAPRQIEPWVDVERAAAHLGYADLARGRQRIYDLVRQRPGSRNPLPHRRDGRRLLFKLSQLDKWIDEGGCS